MFQNSIWDRECLKVGIYHTKYENEDAFQHRALEIRDSDSNGKNYFTYHGNNLIQY